MKTFYNTVSLDTCRVEKHVPTPNPDLSYTGIGFRGDNYGVIREDLVPISQDQNMLLEFLLSTTESAGLIALIGQPFSTSYIREAAKYSFRLSYSLDSFIQCNITLREVGKDYNNSFNN